MVDGAIQEDEIEKAEYGCSGGQTQENGLSPGHEIIPKHAGAEVEVANLHRNQSPSTRHLAEGLKR